MDWEELNVLPITNETKLLQEIFGNQIVDVLIRWRLDDGREVVTLKHLHPLEAWELMNSRMLGVSIVGIKIEDDHGYMRQWIHSHVPASTPWREKWEPPDNPDDYLIWEPPDAYD